MPLQRISPRTTVNCIESPGWLSNAFLLNSEFGRRNSEGKPANVPDCPEFRLPNSEFSSGSLPPSAFVPPSSFLLPPSSFILIPCPTCLSSPDRPAAERPSGCWADTARCWRKTAQARPCGWPQRGGPRPRSVAACCQGPGDNPQITQISAESRVSRAERAPPETGRNVLGRAPSPPAHLRAPPEGWSGEGRDGRLPGCFAPGVMTFEHFAQSVLDRTAEPIRPISRFMRRQLIRQIIEEHRAGRSGCNTSRPSPPRAD